MTSKQRIRLDDLRVQDGRKNVQQHDDQAGKGAANLSLSDKPITKVSAMHSKVLKETQQFLSDLDYYSGPLPCTAESVVERLEKITAEAKYMENVLQRCRERAAVFARDGAQCSPRKSGVAACTWIKMEIDGLFAHL